MSVASGRRVRAARAFMGLNQAGLATKCKEKPWVISAIERGQYRPTYDQMRAIGLVLAEAVGGTIRDFFPNYISRDGKNPLHGGSTADPAGNRTRDEDR